MLEWLGIGTDTLGVGAICLRLLCAMAVGLVIGIEREYTNRPAGMRTHILVALGACAVMVTGELIFQKYQALGAAPDPARMGAQVITGVGFLGAGTILREGSNVKGLTTAASLWAVACLGLAAGGGYYTVAVLGMVFIFATLTIFEVLQHKLVGPETGLCCFALTTRELEGCLEAVNALAQRNRVLIRDLSAEKGEPVSALRFHAELGGPRAKKRRQKFITALAAHKAVLSLKTTDQEEKAGVL